MSTESKGKHRLNDMSIDPSTIKVKPQATETAEGKKVKAKAPRKDPSRYPSHHRGHGKASNFVCVKRNGVVAKVERVTAETKYIAAGWQYCPRNEWRKYLASMTTASTPDTSKYGTETQTNDTKKPKKKSKEA